MNLRQIATMLISDTDPYTGRRWLDLILAFVVSALIYTLFDTLASLIL
jgi:hypothetical protein